MKRSLRLIIPSLILLLLSACDQGMACRNVGDSGYALCQWEDQKTYYLESSEGPPKDGGGALDGTVERIAWNNKFLVAYRHANFRGDKDGWMVIDIATRKIEGPIEDADETARFPSLRLMTAADAWLSLH